jgi:hypothetical protein
MLPGTTWPGVVRLMFFRTAADDPCRLGAYEISPFLNDSIGEAHDVLGKVPTIAALTKSLSAPSETIARKFCRDPDAAAISGKDSVFKGPDGLLIVREDKEDWTFETAGASLKDVESDDMACLLVTIPKLFKDSRYFGSRYDPCPAGK